MEVRDFASTSLSYSLKQHGLEEEWQWIRTYFMRTAKENSRRDKILRYWSQAPEARENIIYKYAVYPWNDHVAKGVCGGLLDTGIFVRDEFGKHYALGFAFDDIIYKLGWLNKLFICK